MIKKYLLMLSIAIGFTLSVNAQVAHTIQVGPGGNTIFSPNTINCVVGDTLVFVWESAGHDVESADGTTIPQSSGSPGDPNYTVVMNTPGSFDFQCNPHAGSGMTGTVNVFPNTAIFTENFDYTSGSLLTANGYTAHSGGGTNAITVTNGGLSYAGYTASGIGNAAFISHSGEDINQSFVTPSVTGGSVYASFLVNVDSVKASGDYFFHFGPQPIGTNFRGRVHVRASGAGIQFGISKSSASPVYDPTVYNLSTTYLIVLKYTLNTGSATDDVTSIFVNPVLGTPEPAASATAAAGESDVPGNNIGTFALRQGSIANGVGLRIDGIKLAHTWPAVTEAAPANPELKFNPAIQSVNENTGTATVTIEINNPNANATSVDVVVKGGSATHGSDYTYSTQTLTFPASSTTAQTINIPIIDDTDQESDETIELVLRNATNNASIMGDSVHIITILANDITAPLINFTTAGVTVNEGEYATPVVSIANPDVLNPTDVQVVLKSTSTGDLTDFTRISGNPFTGNYTIPANVPVNHLDTLHITDDEIAENQETLVFVIRDATNGALIGNDSTFTVTIRRNDQPVVVHFMPATASVSENAGTMQTSIMVMGAESNSNPTSFDVEIKGGTATQGVDYTFATQTVTIPPHTDSMVNLEIVLHDDIAIEPNETIILAIRNITNAGIISIDSIFTGTIKNDDIPFKNIAELKVNDANGVSVLKDSIVNIRGIIYGVDMQGPPTSIQFTIIDPTGGTGLFRSGTNNPPVISVVLEEGDSVNAYGIVAEFNGLTQVNVDSVIVISKGNALKAPRVVTTLDENTESDLVQFNNATIIDTIANTASGTTLSITNGTDTIDLRIDADITLFNQPITGTFHVIGLGGQFDNSNPKNSGYQLLPRRLEDVIMLSEVSFANATYNVTEGTNTVANVTVQLTAATTVDVTVDVAVTGGTATSGSDYTFTSPQTITIPAGQTSASFDITIINDNDVEPAETIVLGLSNATNAIIGSTATTTVTITSEDGMGIANTLNSNSVKMYPNPASSELFIQSETSIQQVIVYNMVGQIVQSISGLNHTETSLSVNNFTKGMYSVRLITAKGELTKRIIVQ